MKPKNKILAGVLLVSLIMLACTFPTLSARLQQKDMESISSAVVQTLSAANLQSQLQPTANSAELVATSVAQTVEALNAQNQAVAPTAVPYVYVVPPTSTPYPCYSARAWDITVPDNTPFSLNQTFNKTWRFKNVGSCTWNTSFRLAFYSGNQLNAPSYVYLPHSVPPGGTVDITVPMQAPSYAGTFTGYWGIYTDANHFFGKVWVKITTGSPVPAYFAVTNVTYAIDHISQPITCPGPEDVTFHIQANITTNGAGTVTYYWTRSYAANTATQSLYFGGASTQTVELNQFMGGVTAAGDYWVKLYIDNPNHQLFPALEFHITCSP